MKHLLIGAACMLFAFSFTSCDKKDSPEPALPTSALYDTLEWFIQGGTGAVAGNGTKMIDDPDHQGQKIQAGRLAIRTVVNKALPIIAGDSQLSVYFPTLLAELGNNNTTGYSKLLESFSDFVQQAVSGQKVCKGKSMKEVHNFATYSRFGDAQHVTSTKADFDKFVGDEAAAQSLNVPASVIGQLGKLLYTTEGDVVQRQSVSCLPVKLQERDCSLTGAIFFY